MNVKDKALEQYQKEKFLLVYVDKILKENKVESTVICSGINYTQAICLITNAITSLMLKMHLSANEILFDILRTKTLEQGELKE